MWKKLTDQAGYPIELGDVPMRIISLVPSQTELLHDLGLGDRVVGITKFCIHPGHWFREKNRVGGTKDVKVDCVRELVPDLVIANMEENRKEDVDEIRTFCPVWTTNIRSIPQALEMIRQVGEITATQGKAAAIIAEIREGWGRIRPAPKRVAYLIWQNPYMVAGGDTYIDSVMEACGWTNVFRHHGRYPTVTRDDLAEANIELLLLSSEPYPFKIKQLNEMKDFLSSCRVILVDGELFSWYGSRMRLLPEYLEELLDSLK